MTSPPIPASDWRAKLVAYLREQARPVFKYGHQPRLYALAVRIAAEESPAVLVDDDVVFAAAFLHDLGVFLGHRPDDPAALVLWDHVAYVCQVAPGLLDSFGFPKAKITAVLDAIREHQPQDTPRSVEATLLRDADILEQIGAIGILRTAAKLDSDTRFHRFQDVARSLGRSLDRLPGELRYAAARRRAVPRVETLRLFLDALHNEAGDNLG